MIIRRALQIAGAVLVLLVTQAPESAAAAPQAALRGSMESTAVCSPVALSGAIRPNSHLLSEDQYGLAPILITQALDARLLSEAKYGPAPSLSDPASDASVSSAAACALPAASASTYHFDDHLELESKYGN